MFHVWPQIFYFVLRLRFIIFHPSDSKILNFSVYLVFFTLKLKIILVKIDVFYNYNKRFQLLKNHKLLNPTKIILKNNNFSSIVMSEYLCEQLYIVLYNNRVARVQSSKLFFSMSAWNRSLLKK